MDSLGSDSRFGCKSRNAPLCGQIVARAHYREEQNPGAAVVGSRNHCW